jgi:hypothetical protein
MNGMAKPDRTISPILTAAFFCGSAWGLGEATLGYLLHLIRVPGLPGAVMAPLGLLLMGRAFFRTGRVTAISATAMVAAAFKLSNLFVPGIELMAVINPVQAILLESLAATALALVLRRAPGFARSAFTAASAGRRLFDGPVLHGRESMECREQD